MSKFANFELSEFIESDTAKKKRIDNTPTFDVVEHLSELCNKILQPLRIAWGSPLTVTSGYRCPELNKAVGGKGTSAHLVGYAADIQPKNGRLDDFIVFAERWMRAHNVMWDQSIKETSKGVQWWHISLRGVDGKQRRQSLTLDV